MRRNIAVFAAGAALLSAGVVTATGTAPLIDPFQGTGIPTKTTPSAHVSPTLHDRFALFRDHPATPVAGTDITRPRPDGLNLALTRTVSTEVAGPVSIVPGNHSACIRMNDGETGAVGSCAGLPHVVAGRLSAQIGAGDHRILAGFVPDGIVTVRITTQTGSSVNAPVHNNIWATRAGRPTTLTLIDDHGGTVGTLDATG